MVMKIGYARTSTVDQEAGFEAQLRDLEKEDCEKVFKEQVSSVGKRKELEIALDFVREGDTLVVTRLDRLARSIRHLGEIMDTLTEKKAHLKIMDMNIDTGSASGELIVNIFGSVAQFERKIMLERQKEGIARAKAEGKYKGRKPTAQARSPEVIKLYEEGKRPIDIIKETGISHASVFRILKVHKEGILPT